MNPAELHKLQAERLAQNSAERLEEQKRLETRAAEAVKGREIVDGRVKLAEKAERILAKVPFENVDEDTGNLQMVRKTTLYIGDLPQDQSEVSAGHIFVELTVLNDLAKETKKRFLRSPVVSYTDKTLGDITYVGARILSGDRAGADLVELHSDHVHGIGTAKQLIELDSEDGFANSAYSYENDVKTLKDINDSLDFMLAKLDGQTPLVDFAETV